MSQKIPADIYYKGEEFKGIFFARFPDGFALDAALESIRSERLTVKGGLVWCGPDRPLQERVPLGFLIGVKTLLVSWNFSKKAIKVREEEMILSVGGTDVLQAVVEDKVLTLKWMADDWEKWSDFTDSGELAELIAKAGERLTNLGEGGTKGWGKGKISN